MGFYTEVTRLVELPLRRDGDSSIWEATGDLTMRKAEVLLWGDRIYYGDSIVNW